MSLTRINNKVKTMIANIVQMEKVLIGLMAVWAAYPDTVWFPGVSSFCGCCCFYCRLVFHLVSFVVVLNVP